MCLPLPNRTTQLNKGKIFFEMLVSFCVLGLVMMYTIGITDVNAYEIVIGGYTNSESGIRTQVGGNFVTRKATKDILNCDRFLFFWISWIDGRYFLP